MSGLSEKNRYVVEIGIYLPAYSSMPLSYWLYAFQTTTYLINRLPTLVLHHQSPYFTLYHKLPAYTHLKAFGSSCFPYLRPYNTHKLQYRSLECAFLHYNSHHKGYLCLDIHSGRVYISHHVIFNEDSFPFKNLSSSLSYFISSSSSLSIHLFIHLSLISPSPPTSSSSTCSPLLPLFPLFHTLCLHLFHLLLPFLLAWTYLYLVWIQIYLLLLTLTIFIIW